LRADKHQYNMMWRRTDPQVCVPPVSQMKVGLLLMAAGSGVNYPGKPGHRVIAAELTGMKARNREVSEPRSI
jgi:hypothetical protein